MAYSYTIYDIHIPYIYLICYDYAVDFGCFFSDGPMIRLSVSRFSIKPFLSETAIGESSAYEVNLAGALSSEKHMFGIEP